MEPEVVQCNICTLAHSRHLSCNDASIVEVFFEETHGSTEVYDILEDSFDDLHRKGHSLKMSLRLALSEVMKHQRDILIEVFTKKTEDRRQKTDPIQGEST